MTATVLWAFMQLHLQSLPTTRGVNQIIFLSILRKMNISKLAIPVLQSAALSVSTAWIFLFSLPSFRSDFSLPSPKQQPLWRYSSLLCLLKYWPFNLCAGGQGGVPFCWCLLTTLSCTSWHYKYFMHTPSALAWRKNPPSTPIAFPQDLKHEFCLHPVLLKPAQKQQLSDNILHVAMVQERNQFCLPVSESWVCLSSDIPCAVASLSVVFYSFCHYIASWLLGNKLSRKLHFSPSNLFNPFNQAATLFGIFCGL